MPRIKTERISVSYRLSAKQREQLKVLAAFHFVSETSMIEKLIAEEIERIKETGRYDERLQNASKAAKGIKLKGS